MNTRERFLAFANFKPLDKPPRYAEFVDPFLDIMTQHLGESPFMRFRMDLPKGARLQPPANYKAPDFSHYYPEHIIGQNGFSLDSNGVGHLNHGFHHFTEYISPLRNATRFEELEHHERGDQESDIWLNKIPALKQREGICFSFRPLHSRLKELPAQAWL
ncbi:MAG: hypothetical protein WCL44_15500 [bacterium]